eukprot:9105775-Prorocentrum_lima.AAC.1
MLGLGQDPDGDDDDRMEVPSPRAGHRRPPQVRERGASTPSSSSKGSLLRGRGGPTAGELLDLTHGRRQPRGRRGGNDVNRQPDHHQEGGPM